MEEREPSVPPTVTKQGRIYEVMGGTRTGKSGVQDQKY